MKVRLLEWPNVGVGKEALDIPARLCYLVLLEMKARHSIYNERDFCIGLEFNLTACLSSLVDKMLSCFWIEGFIPDSISDTNFWVDVESLVWTGTIGSKQSDYRFVASIPQNLLERTERCYQFRKVRLNPREQQLLLTLEKSSNTKQIVDPNDYILIS